MAVVQYFLFLAIVSSCFCTFADNVLIYSDEGVDKNCLNWVVNFFKSRGDNISIVNALFLTNDNKWINSCDKLVIPGGADRPYHKKLKGKGCDNIKKFVYNGGTYIGICAGAYFGCRKVEFALGTKLEVNEQRELGFFPGIARGPMIKTYVYGSEKGASATPVRPLIYDNNSIFYSYHNGGSTFVANSPDCSNFEVVAVYADANNFPAIIRCRYGQGFAILSGVHFEAEQELLLLTFSKKKLDKIKVIAEKIESTKKIKEKFLNTILR